MANHETRCNDCFVGDRSVEETFKYLSELDVQAVELGTGGYPGKAHANPDELLLDDSKLQELKDLVKKYKLEISSLSCHGNPVHPQKEIADGFHQDFEKTVRLAEKLELPE